METVQHTGDETAPQPIADGVAFDPENDAELRRFGVDPFKLKKLHEDARESARRNEEAIAKRTRADAGSEEDKGPDQWTPIRQDLPELGIDPDNLRAFYRYQNAKHGNRAIRPARRSAGYRPPAKLVFSNYAEWQEPVSTEFLVPQQVQIIRQHVAMTENSALLVALWILHTHALEAFDNSPRLVIRSAQPGSGKTRLLRLISLLVPRPLEICAASSRGIVDSLGFRPTLLFDDPAPLLRSTEICAILRNGRQRGAANLLRTTGRETQNFALFTPAALTIEGRTPQLLAGRSIELRLEPLKSGETVLPLRDEAIVPLENLRSMAVRWAADRVAELRRQQNAAAAHEDENWLPLLRIAADAGPDWESRARNLMQRMRAVSGTPLQLLLTDIRSLLDQRAAGDIVLRAPDGKYFVDRDRIRSADLSRLLAGLEGQPWCEWGKSAQPITPHVLAKLLAAADIQPLTLRFAMSDQTGRNASIVERGYLIRDLTDAFSRYLPQPSAEVA